MLVDTVPFRDTTCWQSS